MIFLSIAGLAIDLAGVMMLGVDLVRVQRRLRADAENRVTRLDAILESIGGIDGWAETVDSDSPTSTLIATLPTCRCDTATLVLS